MSFYDDARAKVRQQKTDKNKAQQVAETTKTGYKRDVQQRSKRQDEARKYV